MENDDIVGYSVGQMRDRPPVFKSTREGYITDFSVAESHHRRGIGSKLVSAMLDWFRDNDITRAEVHVVHANATGVAFWRATGFKPHLDSLRLTLKSGFL